MSVDISMRCPFCGRLPKTTEESANLQTRAVTIRMGCSECPLQLVVRAPRHSVRQTWKRANAVSLLAHTALSQFVATVVDPELARVRGRPQIILQQYPGGLLFALSYGNDDSAPQSRTWRLLMRPGDLGPLITPYEGETDDAGDEPVDPEEDHAS